MALCQQIECQSVSGGCEITRYESFSFVLFGDLSHLRVGLVLRTTKTLAWYKGIHLSPVNYSTYNLQQHIMQPIRWEKGEILDVPGRKCYMGCVYPWGSSFSGLDFSYVVTIEAPSVGARI